jgi:flagellar biosynthetic protein FlhB
MADQQDESAEKSHEPSQRKLEKAREKGEIARSADLLTTMAYLGTGLAALMVGGASMAEFGSVLLPLIEQPDRLEYLFFGDGAASAAGMVIAASTLPLLPILLAPAALVLLTLLATRGIIFAPTKLQPKFNRINPIEGIKSKFGRKGLFEFFKSFLKLSIYGLLLALFLFGQLDEIVGSARATPAEGTMLLARKVLTFLAIVTVIAAVIGALDFAFQHFEHRRKNRMTHKEMRDEMKESEGDPMLKMRRRAKAEQIALNQMMGDVPKSDVVIVNPTHYAVALKWSRMPGSAPICVAKGTDEVARRIREVAAEHGVPLHSDPPTARALHATTGIGDEIAPEHYAPVAAAIRFAEEMRRRARERGWG